MSKLTILLCAFSLSIGLNAQKASDKTVAECCNCFKKIDSKTVKTDEQKQAAATDCITKSMMANIVGLADEYGIDMADMNEETGRKIGEKFATKLITDCPASVPYLMKMAGDSKEQGLTKVKGYEREESTTGTFIRLETAGDALVVVVKTADGEEDKFLWIRPFPGSENLEAQGKKLIGKKVSVNWGEFKQYNATLKGYGKKKEILAFKVEG